MNPGSAEHAGTASETQRGDKRIGHPPIASSGDGAILVPGRNCWRLEKADKIAVLVDGVAYFKAFRSALVKAQRSVLIVAWDIDSRVRLLRDGQPDGWPDRLGDFLNEAVSRRHRLHVHVLCWDFAMIYALSREWLPVYKLDWRTHHRLHFRLDDQHPVGACHHQKIVVVDDKVAFVGGLDLTKWRWDTPAHRPKHPRRRDPDDNPYTPHHDVQMAVSGPAAAALGELARERWYRATGHRLRPPSPRPEHDPWPEGVAAEMRKVQVGIARTFPRYKTQTEVREIEQLYLDAIRAARGCIYIENQYFTAKGVGEALAQRLGEESGPEIVLVLPVTARGWLEENTIYPLRARLIRRLRQADRHDRFRVYYPDITGLGDRRINVHAKLMVVDHDLVLVGSANLSNRSMGLDTECDLAVEAMGDPETRNAIATLRNRLLGEHLNASPDEVAHAVDRQDSVAAAVESLGGADRTLKVLEARLSAESESWLAAAELSDPERPIDPERFIERFVPEEDRTPAGRGLMWGAMIVGSLLAGVAAWHWLPLDQWIDLEAMIRAGAGLRETQAAPLIVIGAFVLAGSIAAPLTPLVVITVLTFDLAAGFAYSLGGALLSGFLTYGAGHALGRAGVRRVAGKRLNRLSRRLSRRGLVAILAVRIVPVAPFTVVNLVAGASHIRFRDYALGSVLGMAPGMLALAVLVDRLEASVRNPGLVSGVVVLGVAVLIGLGALATRRWLGRKPGSRAEAGERP